MKRKFLALVLALSLLAGLTALCAADAPSPSLEEQSAQLLAGLKLFRGTGKGFDLERAPLRSEAAAMLVRLYGKEAEADAQYRQGLIRSPFSDVPAWAGSYCAWLYANHLTKGVSATRFGSDMDCSARDYAVFLLRVLGYRDGEDFTYQTAADRAKELGFYHELLFSGTFTRGDLAIMTVLALGAKVSGQDVTLLQQLETDGAVDASNANESERFLASLPFCIEDGSVRLSRKEWKAAAKDLVITLCVSDPDGKTNAYETFSGEALSALTDDDGETVQLAGAAISELSGRLEAKYALKNTDYRFNSYVKGITRIPFLKCNYLLSAGDIQKALVHALVQLQSRSVTLQRTCYNTLGQRFGLTNTYIEVDIDNQRMTYFKNGRLVVSTPVVTGKLNGHQTPQGYYYCHNKQEDITLTGDDYCVFVHYWISVIGDSIGLHDASWRSVFGKEEYVNNGSHGCVNTPSNAMKLIYQNVEDRTPVLIYGRNTWYKVGSADSPVTKNPLH